MLRRRPRRGRLTLRLDASLKSTEAGCLLERLTEAGRLILRLDASCLKKRESGHRSVALVLDMVPVCRFPRPVTVN